MFNPQIHYSIRESLSLKLLLSQMNRIHTMLPYFSNLITAKQIGNILSAILFSGFRD